MSDTKESPSMARIREAQRIRWAKVKHAPSASPDMPPTTIEVKPAAKPGAVTVTGTWDGVRHWLDTARMFEQGKLFAQVMTGFELMELQKNNGIQNGSKAHLSQNGKGDWESILKKEAGLAQSTAYRFMSMAKAAAPRLKKLPLLKDFDPMAKPLSTLSAPQREAMATAVKKLTDGKTQAEFGEALGLWKKPPGAGVTGRKPTALPPGESAGEAGEAGEAETAEPKKKLTLTEETALRREQAELDWHGIARGLAAYKDKFLLLTDADITAQIATLEQALNARKAWLKEPVTKRDALAISRLFQS